MRVFKIDLPATLVSLDPDLDLSVEAVRQQLHRELDALTDELGDDVRQRVAAYFPPSYTTFVRLQLPAGGIHAIATVWVDDPTVRWPSGLFARRAWTLSIPILSHIVKETFERRLPSVRIDIQERKAKIMSLAPARGWLDPVILAIVVALLSAGLWIIAYPWIVARLAGS
jgi:hypothetical protein